MTDRYLASDGIVTRMPIRLSSHETIIYGSADLGTQPAPSALLRALACTHRLLEGSLTDGCAGPNTHEDSVLVDFEEEEWTARQ